MTEKQNLFRRVFHAILEGRHAQAQRQIEEYLRARELDGRPRR
jgi:hypothetical protein